MTDTTPRAGLPELAAAQAQKHVTHNDALLQMDALTCCRILDRDLSTPPGSPSDGDAYLVKATATGAWTDQDGNIAFCVDGGWRFYTPFAGLTAYVTDEAEFFIYDGSSWADLSTVLSLQNLPMLGVNTTADATNKLAVASSAVLLTNVGASIQAFINKQASGDTASFLFETNFSGRAEIGLTGDDNFHFKVSPDGSTWYEGLTIDRNTGSLLLKHVDVTGTTTIGATHLGRIVRADATSGAFNVTLPASADTDDWVIVRKKDSGANRVTVKDNSGTDMAWLSARYDEAMFAYWNGAWSPVRWEIAPLFQVFTSSGTYTLPPLSRSLYVMVIGGGAGGGSARRSASGSVAFGGGGGSSGAVAVMRFQAADISATETVTVGAGGSGGAAVTTDNTDGAAGGAGGATTFGNHLRAAGGNFGAAGTLAALAAGGANRLDSSNFGMLYDGQSSATTAAANGTVSSGVIGSGGGGGTVNAGTAQRLGGTGGGGSKFNGTPTSGGANGGAGAAGSNGASIVNSIDYVGGGGGGGGGCSNSAAGGAGGAGGDPGGGGGGGGASLNGNNSGAGGAGGRGEVRVTTYY